MAAIPTTYRGTRFRSRVEARWAAFFDELRWPWEYEPVDLDGYIPDFILKFYEPLLVEVKSELDRRSLRMHIDKIDRSGWKHDALIVGAYPLDSADWPSKAVGLLSQEFWDGKGWDDGLLHWCPECDSASIRHVSGVWMCARCGAGAKENQDVGCESAELWWARSTNLVQWRPSP